MVFVMELKNIYVISAHLLDIIVINHAKRMQTPNSHSISIAIDEHVEYYDIA